MSDERLKPCPFCGSEEVAAKSRQACEDVVDSWVECRGCGAIAGQVEHSHAATNIATEAWNRREPVGALPECPRCETMQRALEGLFPVEEGFTEAFDDLVEMGLLTEVPADERFREEWDADVMYVWTWRARALSAQQGASRP